MTDNYSPELKIYDPSAGEWISENPWMRDYQIGPGELKTFLYYAFMPDKTGVYSLHTEIGYLDNDVYNFYQAIDIDLSVDWRLEETTGKIISHLNDIRVTRGERAKLQNALGFMKNVSKRKMVKPEDIEMNIRDLLKAVDSVLFIKSVDLSECRLKMAEVLRYFESIEYSGVNGSHS